MFTFHPVISLLEIVNNNGLCKDSDKRIFITGKQPKWPSIPLVE